MLPAAHHPCQQQDGLTLSFCVRQCNLRGDNPPAVIKCISLSAWHALLHLPIDGWGFCSTLLWSRDHSLPRASGPYQPARETWEAGQNGVWGGLPRDRVAWLCPRGVQTPPNHGSLQQPRREVTFLPSRWAPAHMVLLLISLGQKADLKKERKTRWKCNLALKDPLTN